MKNFTASALIKSLALPVFTFLYGLISMLGYIVQNWEGFGSFAAVTSFYLPIAMMLIGGVLPTLLTLLSDIHTERYFLKRVIVIAVYFVIMQYVINQMSVTVLSSLITFAFIGGKIVYEILKVQDENTTGSERAVMLLSDPIYWLFANDIYNTILILADLAAA